MLRFIITALMVVCTVVAHAEQKPDTWVTVAGKGNIALNLNLANISFAKDKITQRMNIIGQFRYVDKTAKNLPPHQTFWIDVVNCANGRGILHGILEPGTEPIVTKWTVSGLTLYDRTGQALCTYYNRVTKVMEENKKIQKYPI